MMEHNNEDYIKFINRSRIRYICCCLFFEIRSETGKFRIASKTDERNIEEANMMKEKRREISLDTMTPDIPAPITVQHSMPTVDTPN